MTSGNGSSESGYRRLAAECLRAGAECSRLAENVDDPVTKAKLISLAASWQTLAESADRVVMPPVPSSELPSGQ